VVEEVALATVSRPSLVEEVALATVSRPSLVEEVALATVSRPQLCWSDPKTDPPGPG
jgi:hypothetical protein